jgi:hypothetical protein
MIGTEIVLEMSFYTDDWRGLQPERTSLNVLADKAPDHMGYICIPDA